ncbi:DUF4145 domain-containing protein [Dolichospermum heterosporum]|uniref:DUF4145 domain-containing protein n=1 Tax=Dolichospermum heterosporum TAC447 TaxID=747523 RepID=A0ABY5LYD5_9CYAN|nr:DUF4145 domain-containing protein [Dolichospermum heterosporum]UUO15568.1 DUF4145 domain-containing protein [Dolichospermum heterosporum TAC447]
MNYKQQMIQGLIDELSKIDVSKIDLIRSPKSEDLNRLLQKVSLLLKAHNMEYELNIWEESLKIMPSASPFDDNWLISRFKIPSDQKDFANEILSAFLNNLNSEDKPSDHLFPMEIVQDTRDYVFRIAKQVNICYTNGCYDACAVMLRRLIETLIIECYEKQGIEKNIKDSNNQYLNLDAMITKFTDEPKFNLSRNTINNLPKLKKIGDNSAHNRHFTASRNDIDKLAQEIRVILPELVNISGLKKK